jgi:PTS system nitrogen regulatory IIA component
MQLASLTRTRLVFPDLSGHDRDAVLRFFADRIGDEVRDVSADEIYRGLQEREQLGSTGVGGGVAIPHCRVDGIDSAVLAVGIARQGIDVQAPDGQLARLFFVIVSPKADPRQNLRFLQAVSRWVREPGNVREILAHPTREEILELLARELPEG